MTKAVGVIRTLRREAVSSSLFPPTSLKAAIDRLGFVQADPIRSPARAQDLILRHRVTGYRNGDLERTYSALDIEEDLLYAYGFMPRPVWRLLHPRNIAGLTRLEKKVLEIVRGAGPLHPKDLEAHLGRKRVVNAWGGYSKATTQALEDLHYRGLLRIARRENGIRIFEPVTEPFGDGEPAERLRQLIMVVAKILSPVPERTLRQAVARFRRLGSPRVALDQQLRAGELERETGEGRAYIRPARRLQLEEPSRLVRFLAPFDPVVWDRLRFEHLWGWAYRFEAYTPVAKRVRGYYAMPLLWGEEIIGWANAKPGAGTVDVEVGFVERRPRERDFSRELEREIARLREFLAEGRASAQE